MQSSKQQEIKGRNRYVLLDSFRGLVLISMIIFHACWDLVYLFDRKWDWYKGTGAYVWQQSICWSFIFLSGFCWSFGKRHLRRGLTVFLAGAAVSLVTVIFMPENRVVFGVLTMLGISMLVMIPLEALLKRIPAWAGFLAALFLFICTKNVNKGYLGFEKWNFFALPKVLYRGMIMTFIGFTEADFFSTDYFSLLPWLFLFLSGYFFCRMMKERQNFMEKYLTGGCRPLSFLGRHSLFIYILHQPVLYGLLLAFREFQLL